MESEHGRNPRISLRGPFLLLVLVLLAAVGICLVAGLKGISGMEVTLKDMVATEAQRMLHITHIRRLFRTEVLLRHDSQALSGSALDELDQRIQGIRRERGTRLAKLSALGMPGAEQELSLLYEAHRNSAHQPPGSPQVWEQQVALLLERTDKRFTDLLRDAQDQVDAARRLLLGASAAALLAALGLGAVVLRRVRQAREELAHSEEQFRNVVDAAPSLLVVLSAKRQPILMSTRASGFLGQSAEALSRDFFTWVKTEERPAIDRRFEECLSSGSGIAVVDVQAVRDDGSTWNAWLSLSTVKSRRGPQVLVQVLDITAQRKAEAENRTLEAQLRQAQKMESIGLLAGGVAHDFNNLLTAIKGYASLLSEETTLDPSAKEGVDGIQSAADRAAMLTRKLLSFSRKQVIEPRPVKLGDVVGGMEQLLRRMLGEDVRLQVRAAPDLHVCMVDNSQVEQILMNLAVNSRQAMPQGGLLTIETNNIVLGTDYARSHPEVTPGPYVQLVVSDTGTGMSPEVQRRAFEPFFTTKPAGQGTGLGLSVVYGAVRQQGGHINLYSEPNVGTTFRIYWPAAEGQTCAAKPETEKESVSVNNELLILVEDDELVRSFARRALRGKGYQVVDVESAEKAIELAKTLASPPDLLLTDVILPGLHGPALAEALRLRFPKLPVLFCSGYSEQLMSETGHLPAGATLLQKPYDARTLVAQVREMLNRTA